MRALILAGAIFHLIFALFHLTFWRLLEWPRTLAPLGAINRAVMQILNLCLTFFFFVVAYLSWFHADALLASALGQALLASIALFWLLRAAQQIFFFGLSHLFSAVLFAAFVLGTLLYAVPYAHTLGLRA